MTYYSRLQRKTGLMTQKSNSVTIRDVAREAGVSVATVSRYINRTTPVSTEAAERLERVMVNLHYLPHAAARHLATRKTRVIGLLLTNMHNEFFGPLLNGIESAVRENGYNLLVATYRANNYNDDHQPPIGPHNTDGLLVFADSLDDRQLDQLHEKRHIIFLQGPANQEDSRWRQLGYKASLEAHNIPFNPRLILRGEFEQDVAYKAMKEFLVNDHPDFDAVFSGDDEAAIGTLMALQEAGYRVPERISVVGFDDQKLSAFLSPPLTTVRAPTEAVGRAAGEHIFAILQGSPINPVTLLPTEIILRRSCGCNG